MTADPAAPVPEEENAPAASAKMRLAEWGRTALVWLRSLADVVLPRYCCVCGRRLLASESHTCAVCLAHLPYTGMKGERGNVVERLFQDDLLCIRRAHSLLYYYPATEPSHIFASFKYFHRPDVAVAYGRLLAEDLEETDFFNGIDLIIPVPLSKQRLRHRGYNQSERLASGVASVTGLPVELKAVVRVANNPTQTHLTPEEREENVRNIFSLTNPSLIAGKHVLLIDDIITTGSTLRSCARTLMQADGVSISILSLGLSSWHKGLTFPTDIHPGFR